MNLAFDPTITISVLLSLAVAVFAWFRTRRQAVDDRFKSGSERMDRHESRLGKVENSVAAMPGKDDIHGLQLQMAEMVGSMREMNAKMEGNQQIWARVEAMVTRHDEHLLDGGK